MQGLAQTLTTVSGWRRNGTAFVAGAMSNLAFAPLHIWPVMLLTLPSLVCLLDGCFSDDGLHSRSRRSSYIAAGWVGWWFGFGFFLTGLYWIGFAFLVEAEIFAVLLPFAVTLMPAGLALFFAAATAVAGLGWRPGAARVIALAIALAVAEWLRGHVLTGFPWDTLGYALAGPGAMMQWASIFGVYTLTLFAVMIFGAPAVIWAVAPMRETARAVRFCYPAVMTLVLTGTFWWGNWRLQHGDLAFVDNVRLRIVQPNIPQSEKWKPENRPAVFQRYLQVSRDETLIGGLDRVTHLIWPESAVPFLLLETPDALEAVADLLPDGATFITGAARGERATGPEGGAATLKVYNSLLVMGDKARLQSAYDKVHLVPFGEYLPFQDTLEKLGFSQLTRLRGGFTPGRGSRLMKAHGVPDFVALICYEIIFPGGIRESGMNPRWMLNLTNDAWFGNSAGPYQHFHQARVRAVEQGLPLVRAANNGISAVTDPYGRIVARLPRNTARALDSGLPMALPPTVFSRWGIWIFWGALGVAAMFWYSAAGRLRRE